MSEDQVYDDAQMNTVKLNFFDGEKWVDDEERSQTVVRLIESGACKQKKLPTDYVIDMNETLGQCLETHTLTEDEGVIKYLMVEGNGDRATEESIVKARFECRLLDGKLKDIEAIRSNIHKISFLSTKPMRLGIRRAILSMKQGERSWFRLVGKYNFQEDNFEEQDKETVTFYQIELVDVRGPKKHVNNSDLDERMMMIDTFREKGVLIFKSGNIDQAKKIYRKALNYVNNSWPKFIAIDQKTAEKIKWSRIIFTNNLAQCEIKSKKFSAAKSLLEHIIELSRGSSLEVKTYYRMALSLCELDEQEKACQLLKTLRSLVGLTAEEDSDVTRLEKRIRNEMANGGKRKK